MLSRRRCRRSVFEHLHPRLTFERSLRRANADRDTTTWNRVLPGCSRASVDTSADSPSLPRVALQPSGSLGIQESASTLARLLASPWSAGRRPVIHLAARAPRAWNRCLSSTSQSRSMPTSVRRFARDASARGRRVDRAPLGVAPCLVDPTRSAVCPSAMCRSVCRGRTSYKMADLRGGCGAHRRHRRARSAAPSAHDWTRSVLRRVRRQQRQHLLSNLVFSSGPSLT